MVGKQEIKVIRRRLVSLSLDDAARFRARVYTVVHHLNAVDEKL
jgi:hypothetical protein